MTVGKAHEPVHRSLGQCCGESDQEDYGANQLTGTLNPGRLSEGSNFLGQRGPQAEGPA
jgi:hypothetical protein